MSGCVSSAALLQGGVGYLGTFVEAPGWLLFVACLAALSGLAAWGVTQSVGTAAALSVVEIGGLLLVIGSAPDSPVDMVARIAEAAPPFDVAAVASISAAALLAFFAFIGFEDMVNVAEEVIDPRSVFPKAIGLTLAITALLYMGVSVVAVTSVPLDTLAQSDAPLATLFEHLTGWGTGVLSAIAIVAVLNGVLIQLVMATRILYGLSRQGQLPAQLGRVSAVTHTPLAATALVTVVILAFGLSLPLAHLAEITSVVTLSSFALVNLSLWRLKRTRPQPIDVFAVPQWVPLAGFATSGLFLVLELGRRLFG